MEKEYKRILEDLPEELSEEETAEETTEEITEEAPEASQEAPEDVPEEIHKSYNAMNIAILAALLLVAALLGVIIINQVFFKNSAPDEKDNGDTYGASDEENGDIFAEETDDIPAERDSFNFSEGLDENGFFEGVRALDYIEMFDYEALPIPNDIHYVSEDIIRDEMEHFLNFFPIIGQITDRAVADGDTVNIDYVGSVDGVEFERGSTEGMGATVTIGVTNYIDGFLEQLIGGMPGETINVQVTFPEFYPNNPDLEGKKALFVTTINYIETTTYPELTDEFVLENLFEYFGWSTVEELRLGLITQQRENAVRDYIHQYLTTEVKYSSVPEKLIERHENMMLNEFYGYSEMYGMALEEMLGFEDVSSVDELLAKYKSINTERALFYLIIQAVAEDAGITAGEDDLKAYFTENVGISDYSMYQAEYGLPFLKQAVLLQMVLDFIFENAVLV